MKLDVKRTWWIAALVVFAGLLVYFSFFGHFDASQGQPPTEEFPPAERPPST
jgi:hypothetical protein